MSRKVSKQKKSFPKTDVRYWEGKVAFQTAASRTYSVQIQHANRRARINLKTANKAQAALLARKLYLELCANGWDETLRRRRGDPARKKVNVTVGEYIEAVPQGASFRQRRFRATRRRCARSPATLPERQAREARWHQAAHTHAGEDRSLAR